MINLLASGLIFVRIIFRGLCRFWLFLQNIIHKNYLKTTHLRNRTMKMKGEKMMTMILVIFLAFFSLALFIIKQNS